jgi:hypothetical protein
MIIFKFLFSDDNFQMDNDDRGVGDGGGGRRHHAGSDSRRSFRNFKEKEFPEK